MSAADMFLSGARITKQPQYFANSTCWRAQDGDWHMIGLTTHRAGGKGYQMYLDGALVADMAASGSYTSVSPVLLTSTCQPLTDSSRCKSRPYVPLCRREQCCRRCCWRKPLCRSWTR